MARAVPPRFLMGDPMRFQSGCSGSGQPRRRRRAHTRRAWMFCSVMLGMLLPLSSADAQLEVLLRGVDPALPLQGVCAVYRFESREPDGSKDSQFVACVESVPEEGPIILQLSAGDSLQVRLEIARTMFLEHGAELSENILSVERTQNGQVERLTPEDWQKHPALAPAAPLPVLADSSLGERQLVLANGKSLTIVGRHRRESRSMQRTLSGVLVTTSEDRQLEIWTAPEAPILGVVAAEATVRSERVFSEPIPGVPSRGPRTMHYSLKLLEILQPAPR